MSRCFRFPPPGYMGSEGSSLTLIDSIKLQREWDLEKAKIKKDRKREKKGRRKEKKEKSKTCLLREKDFDRRSTTDLTSLPIVKILQTENEQLERSSLTEEAPEQRPSTSSDSTHTSSKRKREEVNSIRGTGNVIRIRLSSRKKNDVVSKPDPCLTTPTSQRGESPLQKQNALISRQQPCSTTLTSQWAESPSQKQNSLTWRQQPCSTSGRTQLATCDRQHGGQVVVPSVQEGNNSVISDCPPTREANRACSSSIPTLVIGGSAAAVGQFSENKLPVLPPRPERECSALVGPKVIPREDDIAVRDPKSLNKKLVKAESRYRDLFSNWVPPPPQTELEPEDLDWLFFKKKQPDNRSDKKLKPSDNVLFGSSSLLFPRAQFIPEADIYALPFTIPF